MLYYTPDLSNSKQESNIIPVIRLLPTKTMEIYVKRFYHIHEAISEWNRKKVIVGYTEAAAIPAFRESFHFAEINGCFFHKKTLWWRVQDSIVKNDYLL